MTSQADKMEDMLSWFKSHNGYVNPSIEYRNDPTFGLAPFSKAAIKADDRLVSCPFELAITASSALRAIQAVTGVDGEASTAWSDRVKVVTYIVLHWVWDDLLTADSSKSHPQVLLHGPYIASLPSQGTILTPLFYTDDERALLKGTNVYSATLERERNWKAEWESLRNVLESGAESEAIKSGFTWERWLQASTFLTSRAFPSSLLEIPEGESSGPEGIKDDAHAALMPGLDSLNHRRGQPITWLSSPVASSSDSKSTVPAISFVAPEAISADQQIFNNYGPKPNDELLLGYGFVLSPNPDDSVKLRLGAPNSEKTEEMLKAKGLSMDQAFTVSKDGTLPKDLVEVVRVMLAAAKPHAHGHAHEGSEEELQDELDALEQLGGMLDDRIVAIEDAQKEVSGEAREEVRLMCEAYVSGQKTILEAALGKISDRIEIVEELIGEGNGCACCM